MLRFFFLVAVVVGASISHAGLSPNYIIKAAKSGDSVAQLLLAEAYYKGDGLDQNYTQALHWYEKAAVAGEPEAALMAGEILLEGLNGERDERRAVMHFKSAADKGLPEAQYIYARCLASGSGLPVDATNAAVWYEKSAASGYKPALEYVNKQRFFSRLHKELKEPCEASDVNYLLSRFNSFSSFRGLSDSDKALARKEISRLVSHKAPPKLKKEFAAAEGRQGLFYLVKWKYSYGFIIGFLGDNKISELDALAVRNIERVTSVMISDQRREYNQEVKSLGRSIEALKASVAFERNQKEELESSYTLAQFDEVKRERKAHRKTLYSAFSSELLAMASNTKYVTEFDKVVSEYMYSGDGPTELEKKYSIARRVYTPFIGYPGGDYLNALYGGDWTSLKRYDREYMEPYTTGYIGQSIKALGKVVDSLSAMGGQKSTAGRDMFRSFRNSSLITPVLSSYLVNYDAKYSTCLRPDAVKFKKTVTSETVYRNGFGNRVGGYKNPDQISYFTVNKEFMDIFKKVGLAEAESGNARFIETIFNPNSSSMSNLSGVIQGIDNIMDDFKCSDPKIKRLEANMIEYFNI
ncbi:Sel1 repeat-containing protein [Thalassolituus maritimus]|uniref:Sel1 repeat-containing protein n=1 Tax=Thalassolituus maritimus TaxID=484498 RepID=A0A1N7JIQ1_9GAMM|nr:SEL1-like repeat protein [Thalassolituus maritimus]SIS49141.1 Sel1 repeat-containing protein [Thalassolituus maritimus]